MGADTLEANIPEINRRVYCYLFAIETALRELFIETGEATDGKKWYKRRLTADVLPKYQSALERERLSPWSQIIPHHPIYYLDFPDLKRTIEREDNWRDLFQTIFRRKEIYVGALANLEVVRNKIAHNRKATDGDLQIVASSYSMLRTAIGYTHFDSLTAHCTIATDIPDQLTALQGELSSAYARCRRLEPLPELPVWASVNSEWWFDDSYLGQSLASIKSAFLLMVDYGHFPRTRGTGHLLEKWLRSSDIS